MFDFKGKYAVVTGAGKGIGAATAKRFLKDGAAGVALLDMDMETASRTAAELDPTGKRAVAVKCNVASLEDVEAAFKKVYATFGRVDILVNNAGIIRDSMFHKMSPEDFKLVLDVHLFGTMHCTKQVVDGMREQDYGKIVNLASISMHGNPGQANYAAAKAGIVGFTKTLARELGRKHITVNAIAPGYINTDIVKTVPKEVLEASKNYHPMQRFGEADEVASVIAFLSSDDSSYVNGDCITVSGGA